MINVEFIRKRLNELRDEATANNHRAWIVKEKRWMNLREVPFGLGQIVWQRDSGLKDNNNKIVFVGDVVMCVSKNKVGVVELDKDTDVFSIYWNNRKVDESELGKLNIDDIEVVGNIFENEGILKAHNLK